MKMKITIRGEGSAFSIVPSDIRRTSWVSCWPTTIYLVNTFLFFIFLETPTFYEVKAIVLMIHDFDEV